MTRPHVVILGAGCSRATCPTGDANGSKLPLMNDFLQVIPALRSVLKTVGIPTDGRNFEEIYSELHERKELAAQSEAERIIRSYFKSLCLPNHPTLYDYLVLSLREKDVIATFNWVPFLVQAVARNSVLSDRLPKLLFLHGNVLVGTCLKHSIPVAAPTYSVCPKCQGQLAELPLLYPIREKDYDSDPVISGSWKELGADLKASFMVTIFGYSAPKSDTAAVDLLKNALGSRPVNQIEIIDIRPERDIRNLWEPFIEAHKYHYKIRPRFDDSWIAKHPRRTGEAFRLQYWDAEFVKTNPIPHFSTFDDLWRWFEVLLKEE